MAFSKINTPIKYGLRELRSLNLIKDLYRFCCYIRRKIETSSRENHERKYIRSHIVNTKAALTILSVKILVQTTSKLYVCRRKRPLCLEIPHLQ